ncbi:MULTISPECIES: S24 family peptidase [Methylobacterium]|uniref:S24 family peptidase n=1 Tax=Methylobacterium TaxID=407 RepID=UPI0013ECC639|nr:S24 family peptidase [Methylobacterium sp. DB0501]NGM33852.1 S24 family peptidase [Methylobacterium sp. DB0501]
MTDTTPTFDADKARLNIAALLESTGRSSFYISEEIGRNRTYIDDFLRGKKKSIPYKEIVAIATKLGVSPNFIAGMQLLPANNDTDLFLPSWGGEDEQTADNWLKSSPVKWNGSRIVATTEDDPYHFKLTVETGERSFAFAEKNYNIPSWAKIDAMSKVNVNTDGIPELDTSIPEIGYPQPVKTHPKGRIYQPGVVIDIWDIPWKYLSDELRLDPKNLDIIAITDSAMTDQSGSGYLDGDRVFIDRSDCNIRRGGVFCITDQDITLVRQIEIVRNSQIDKIKCISYNPRFDNFEAELGEDVKIIGRVVLRIGKPR